MDVRLPGFAFVLAGDINQSCLRFNVCRAEKATYVFRFDYPGLRYSGVPPEGVTFERAGIVTYRRALSPEMRLRPRMVSPSLLNISSRCRCFRKDLRETECDSRRYGSAIRCAPFPATVALSALVAWSELGAGGRGSLPGLQLRRRDCALLQLGGRHYSRSCFSLLRPDRVLGELGRGIRRPTARAT